MFIRELLAKYGILLSKSRALEIGEDVEIAYCPLKDSYPIDICEIIIRNSIHFASGWLFKPKRR